MELEIEVEANVFKMEASPQEFKTWGLGIDVNWPKIGVLS